MMTSDSTEELRYKQKCKDLRKRIREIEEYNELTALSIERTKKAIQRARLERALLFERLEGTTNINVEDSDATPSPPGSPVPPTAPFKAYCAMERENLKKEHEKEDVEQLLVSTWKQMSSQDKIKYVEEGNKRSAAVVRAMAGDITLPGTQPASTSEAGTPLDDGEADVDKDESLTPGPDIKNEHPIARNGSFKPSSNNIESEVSESEFYNSDIPPPSSEL